MNSQKEKFFREKESLKEFIDHSIKKCIDRNQHIKDKYFITFHGKFVDSENFHISPLNVSSKIPRFLSNTLVFWVSNKKGICELLWSVSKDGNKNKVEFNKKGVAYLTAKGAFPNMGANHGKL